MPRNDEKIIGFLDGCMAVSCNFNTAHGIYFRIDSLKSINRTIYNENFIEEYVDTVINSSDEDYLKELSEEYETDSSHLRNKLIKTFLNNPKEFFEFWNRDKVFYLDMIFEDEVVAIGDGEYFYRPDRVLTARRNHQDCLNIVSGLTYVVNEDLLDNIKKIIPCCANDTWENCKNVYFDLRDKISNQLKEIDNNKISSNYLQRNKGAIELSRL